MSVQPPSGFRDFSPAESDLRSFLIETITAKYRAFGFQQIFTSACESLPALQGKGGGHDNEKLIFKIQKRGEQFSQALQNAIAAAAPAAGNPADSFCDLGLRFDLTLPLARYISHKRAELPMPFKVFHIGPVWRADRPQKGRFREFYQCDVDVVGTSGIGAEIDCLGAILSVFSALGISGVEVHLNDRRLLQAIGMKFGFAPTQWAEALITLDKFDKIGVDGVSNELTEKFGELPALKTFLTLFTEEGREIEKFESYHAEACANLREIIACLGDATVCFNAALVRGQDYYTGTIFEVRHPSLSGSLAGGGRYDKLLELFGGQETPAFGGSIGFERLTLLLEDKPLQEGMRKRPQIFFPLLDAKLRPTILKLAAGLRARGINVDVFPDAAKLKTQFKYADTRAIPFTAILGENELTQRKITVKDMTSSTQAEYDLDTFVKEFADKLR